MLRKIILVVPILALSQLFYANYELAQTPVIIDAISVEKKVGTKIQQTDQSSVLADATTNEMRFEKIYVHTLSRPLFEKSRRVYEPPPPPKKIKPVVIERPVQKAKKPVKKVELVKVVAKPPLIRLMGTNITPASTSALIQIEGAETKWVSVSDKVKGWSVAKISPDLILLRNLDQTSEVSLFPDTND